MFSLFGNSWIIMMVLVTSTVLLAVARNSTMAGGMLSFSAGLAIPGA